MAFADLVPGWGENGVGPAVRVLAEQADGKIIAVDTSGSSRPVHLVRLNADGTKDLTFSKDGQITWSSPILAARQLSSGKIAIVYSYKRKSNPTLDSTDVVGLGVARFYANGSLDRNYGNNGSNAAAFRESKIGQYSKVADVAIDADGTAYIADSGNTLFLNSAVNNAFTSFILKFRADGQIDASFGVGGVVTLPGRVTANGEDNFVQTINTIAIRDSGSLLIAGTEQHFRTGKAIRNPGGSTEPTSNAAYVTRLAGNGAVDPRFGTAGTFYTPQAVNAAYPGDGESARVLRQDDGHVLLVTRLLGQLRILTLSASGRLIPALNTQQPDTLVGSGDLQAAAQLQNGNLIIVRQTEVFEARRTDNGFDLQPPRLPAGVDGKSVSNGYIDSQLLVLRNGNVLLAQYGSTFEISPGDGQTPREDNFAFARQYSVSTTKIDTGVYSSIDIAPLDVFYHDTRGGLKYRQRTPTGRWGALETVDAAADAGVYLAGIGTSVVYMDGATADLRFATRLKNGTWKTETIDSAGATGLYCSVVQTGSGTLAVAYYDRTKGDLRLARRATDGTWTRETIDRSGNVGRYASITIRPDGGLSIAYATGITSGVRIAEQSAGGGAWTLTDLAAGVDVDGLDIGSFLANADNESVPAQAKTAVAFYDASRSDLFVAYRPDAGVKFRLLHDKARGEAGLEPRVLPGDTMAVSFYDRGRNQVRATSVSDFDGVIRLVPDVLPKITNAGPLSGPVTEFTVPGVSYKHTYSKGYTSDYAWFDAAAEMLKIRGIA